MAHSGIDSGDIDSHVSCAAMRLSQSRVPTLTFSFDYSVLSLLSLGIVVSRLNLVS